MDPEQAAITEFMVKGGQYVAPFGPEWPPESTVNLRLSLVNEEYWELADAVRNQDLVATVDALVDLIYVIKGFATALGVDLAPVFREVHRSNLSKFYGTVPISPTGKILKGSGFTPPNIEPILKHQIKKANATSQDPHNGYPKGRP